MRRLTHEQVEELAPLYVLGALDADESAAVRAHLASCSRPHDELATLGGVAPYLAEAVEQVEPPAALGERIRGAVESDLRARRRDDSAVERLMTSMGGPPRPTVAPVPEEPVDLAAAPRARPFDRIRPYLELAAVVLVAVLVGVTVLLQGEVRSLREREEQIRQAVVAAGQPDAVLARIAGTESAPGAGGFAVLRPSQTGYLVVTGLPLPPAGRTYQAWYIEAGTPRSAGLMDVRPDGTGVLPGLQLPEALEAVALTQELAGGAATPTAPIYAIGEVGG
jgi:hypothetical protein